MPATPADRSRAPTTALEERELDAILRGLQDRFSWPLRASRYRLLDVWGSRTAVLHRCRGEAGRPDVVVKVVPGWSAEEARRMHAETERLGRVLAAGATAVGLPRPLGWEPDPPAICMEHVEGLDVIHLYTDLGHAAWERSTWTPASLARECGRCLGVYHSAAHEAGWPSEAGLRDLALAARPMGVGPRRLRALARHAVVAPSFGDIGPHQFRLDPGDRLLLLDPPPAPEPAPVQRDLARFAFGVEKALVRDRSLGRRGRGRRLDEIVEALLEGYAETGPTDPRTPEARTLLSLYRGQAAAGMARQRLRSGHRREAVRHGLGWARAAVRFRLRGR